MDYIIRSIISVVMIGGLVVFLLYVIWDMWLVPWTCMKCGKKYRGHANPDPDYPAFEYRDVGPCCVWRKISHAEYNRAFEVENKMKEVK